MNWGRVVNQFFGDKPLDSYQVVVDRLVGECGIVHQTGSRDDICTKCQEHKDNQ